MHSAKLRSNAQLRHQSQKGKLSVLLSRSGGDLDSACFPFISATTICQVVDGFSELLEVRFHAHDKVGGDHEGKSVVGDGLEELLYSSFLS